MERILAYLFLTVIVAVAFVFADSSTCVADETASLKACFDPLKAEVDKISGAGISAVNELLCGSQKQQVECIIKKFKMCPKFKNETFLNELNHIKSGFHVKELFYVGSADLFCKCAPTYNCLDKVETDNLAVKLKGSPAWDKMPNTEYICGNGKSHLDCVAKALPECDAYLQYKHNEKNAAGEFDVSNIEHAALYAEKHCGENKDANKKYVCVNKRADWYALKECSKSARLYTQDVDKTCGLRKCVELSMGTCHVDEMNYFIEAINVFSDYKVDGEPCTLTSSASSLLATISTIPLAYFLSLLL